MKKLLAFSFCLILFSSFCTGTDDLSFREGLTSWRVSGPGKAVPDTKVKTGSCSVRLENGGRIWKMLTLEPDTRYELTFYIKGKDISSGERNGARIILSAGGRSERITTMPGNELETGTFDWKQGRGIIDTARSPGEPIRLELNLTGTGTVWFDELKLSKQETYGVFRKAHTEAVRAALLVPQGMYGFFAPGEEVRLRLLIDGTAKDYEYTLTVRDDTGKIVHTQGKTMLDGEIVLPGQVRGYYSAESDIYADGVKAYTIQSGFAVTPVPGKRDPFFLFGLGVIPSMHDAYKRVGCGSITMVLHGINMPEEYDRKIKHFLSMYSPYLKSSEFQLNAYVGTGLGRIKFRTPEESEAGYPILNDLLLRQYLKLFSDMQPKLKVKNWFIGQETPSSATNPRMAGTWSEAMAQFVTMVRMGSRQLKKLDPEIKIFAGGNNVMARTDDIEPIQMGDIVKDFDHYYIDAYTGNWDLAQGGVLIPEIDLMKFYRKASALSVSLGKGKEIVNNETGYCIPFGAPFDRGLALTQARLTARSFIISRAAPIMFYHLFTPNSYETYKELRDTDPHMTTIWKCPVMGKKYYYIPLPGGAMYATAASELAFVKFAEEIHIGSVYSYVFTKPDGSTLVTLWDIDRQRNFEAELPDVSQILNMYGRDITGQELIVGPDPVYITFRRGPEEVAELMRNAIQANVPEVVCAALPGTVYVKSLIKETREGEIRIPGQNPVKVKILPEKVSSFDLPVSEGGELVIGSRSYEILLEKKTVFELKRFTSFENLRKTAPGMLRVPDHVRPLDALHPERCYFKSDFNPGGHDVSAKYWASYDDENFYLTVEVDDPIHIQRKTGKEIWRDDCLQFVLSPEDYPPSTMLNNAKKPYSEYNFGLALTSKGAELVQFLGKNAGPRTYPASVVREGDITRYELTIPWSAVGGKAKRFGFMVWDNNSVTNPRAPYRLELTPGIADDADSSKLAKVKYEE